MFYGRGKEGVKEEGAKSMKQEKRLIYKMDLRLRL